MHDELSWQHLAWFASTLGTSRSYLVSQLLNFTGLADDRHRERVLGGLTDLRFQIGGHLQEVGALASNLLLRIVAGVSRGRILRLGGRGGGRAGDFFRRRWVRSRRGLCMTAQQTDSRRNGKRGATCQQTELPTMASKPTMGFVGISAKSAVD